MPFQKGDKKINLGGRPKGSKNAKTEQWNKLANDIVNKHSKKFNRTLNQMEGREFAEIYLKILKYFKPALSSQTLVADITIDKSKIADIFPKIDDEKDKSKDETES